MNSMKEEVKKSEPEWISGYKETKNFLHNEMGITKEKMDTIIEKVVTNEIERMMKNNPELLQQAVKEVVREEMLYAIKGHSYPAVHGHIRDFRDESKVKFSQYISSILKEEILSQIREQFNVGVNIQQKTE